MNAIRIVVLLVIAAGPALASMLQKSPPLYDEKQLQSEFTTWMDGLDYGVLPSEYPKAIKDLLSVDTGRQMAAIKLLGETANEKALPWLYPFLSNENAELRIWAQSSTVKLLSGVIHFDQSKREERRKSLRPAAWLALQMFRRPDDGNAWAYAAEITGMLRIAEFERELALATKSIHPAVSNSAVRAANEINPKTKCERPGR